MNHSEIIPVVIVGAGPVGLALANELGYRKVPYLLIEQGFGEVIFPAGEGIFSRTMEHIRRWGYAKELRLFADYPVDMKRNILFATSFDGKLLARFRGVSNEDEPKSNPYSPEGGMFCPKKSFDPALKNGAEMMHVGELRYGSRLVSFEQNKEYVNVLIEDVSSGNKSTIKANYLAAADGARSAVRKDLNIEYVGSFAEGHNFAIYFESKDLPIEIMRRFGSSATQLHMLNVKHRPYLVAVNGHELWRLSMYIMPDDNPNPIECLSNVFGPDLKFRLIKAQPWKGNRVVAESYSVGRVFMLGDAVHLRWPKGGFGANTGIGDAVDLGWKIWAVINGWGGDKLLDSYELERRPIAVRNVNEASNNRILDEMICPTAELDEDGPSGDAARRAISDDIYAYRLREFRTAGIQLGYRYRNSPICISDDSLEPADDHMLYSPSTWPGSRAPHAWLEDGRSTLDLFGYKFVLLRFNLEIDCSKWIKAAAELSVPFECVDISSHQIRLLYERDLVLVRPDGHVAWRGISVPSNIEHIFEVVTGH